MDWTQNESVRLALAEQTLDRVIKLQADQESRLRKIERVLMYGCGAVGVVGVLTEFYKTFHSV